MGDGALPNLILIGAAKCGTSSLHFYLGPLENSFLYSVQQPIHELYQRSYTRVFTLADGI